MKSKENEASSSQNIEENRAEKKSDSDDNSADRSKFKKVEMAVFIGEDPDFWLFRAERPKGLAEMVLIAQLVENREIIRGEANLNGFSSEKYPSQSSVNAKPTANQFTSENKGNTLFPIRTITPRSPNAGEVCKEGTSKRLPDLEFQLRRE
ncbi:histone-lysine N-methyltransferase ASHR1 isoform X1 [Cucumis melo var. makuwa]|uniref:Histone-lysine N-methyltransferase ASHR1 isoform X1 n=1 Tax=Cucumis melo var. makuwa TaxID=1194695 RepID=A0A5A7VHU8_CUCMM|nr:histone-lysine N-methyltransferase ASHR1 isoform X1 [Cucumis melo var. makuwa]TYK30216.1 histone-lysine N-methyltransferase ASHR1 isoform X1 [Cucumis melo var. makuwa]